MAEEKGSTIAEVARRVAGSHAWAVGRIEDFDALLDMVDRGESGSPRDPRGTGYEGGYPQINTGSSVGQAGLLAFARIAYARSAPARVLVDRVAADEWAEWFDLLGGNEKRRQLLEAWMKRPTGRLGEKPIWWWFERATRFARRDGRSLLHFGLTESGADPEEAPGNVHGVQYLQIIRQDRILAKEVDDDPESKTFGDVLNWTIQITVDGKPTSQIVHAGRVIPFIPCPKEDDQWDGDSVLITNINYVEALENVLSSVVESYFSEASPRIIVYRTEPGPTAPGERAQIKKELGNLGPSGSQRAFVSGVKVEMLAASGQLADPTPHWNIAVEAFAMASGMPKSVLRGDAAGDLASAKEDGKRWAGVMSKVQQYDADPLVHTLIKRLGDWRFETWQQPASMEFEIHWRDIYRESPKDEADRELVVAQALKLYVVDMKIAPPQSLDYDETEEEFLLKAIEPKPVPAAFGNPAAPGGPPPSDAPPIPPVVGDESKVEEAIGPPGVQPLVSRFEKSLIRVFRRAFTRAAALVESPNRVESKPTIGWRARREADAGTPFEDPEWQQDLGDAIEAGLLDSLNEGSLRTLEAIGAEDIHRLMQQQHAAPFKTLARDLALSVSRRLSEDARRIVAEGVTKGHGLRELKASLMERFGTSRSDAERIARTEGLRGYNAGAADALSRVGANKFEFIALAGADEECMENDGKTFSLVDLGNRPPLHPRCRCQLVAALGEEFQLPGLESVVVEGHTMGRGVSYTARRSARPQRRKTATA